MVGVLLSYFGMLTRQRLGTTDESRQVASDLGLNYRAITDRYRINPGVNPINPG
jgi:hypothetical protein